MQRIAAFLFVLFLVTLTGGCATATSPAPVSDARATPPRVQPSPAAIAPTPAASTPEDETVVAKTFPLVAALPPEPFTAPQREGRTAHIALLLPLNSASFGQPAEAVKQGAIAASLIQTPAALPLQTYPTGDRVEDILSAYQQALQAGARIVVGPLTRNAVTALAKSGLVSVPTLALNFPEGDTPLPENFYLFGLTAEGEARQIARLAFNEGRRTALTVTANTMLAKRVQQAFADAWRALGGTLVAQANVSADRIQFPALHDKVLKHPADMIFLAADADLGRLVRPYLDANTPTYAVSMIYAGNREVNRNVDLNGVQFVEMPWFLQPDNPAVMIYPHAGNFSIEQERLYALGIDAFRLAVLLAQQRHVPEGSVLDGVTGQISLFAHQFQREMTVAQFERGEALAIEFADPNRIGEQK